MTTSVTAPGVPSPPQGPVQPDGDRDAPVRSVDASSASVEAQSSQRRARGPRADRPRADRPGAPAWRRWSWRRLGWKRWVSPLALLALWQLASSTGLVSAQKVPSPATVWTTAVHLVTTDTAAYGTLQGAMAASLERMAIGFSLGATAAVLVALVAGLSRLGEHALDPPMQMLRTLPLFGLVPVFIVWFGIGQLPKVLLIALAAAVPLYLNVYAGIRGVDARLGELAHVLGLRRLQFVRHVVLPGALPQTLVGLRQSLGAAWLALVVAEQLNVSNGLGFMISQATQFLQDNVIFVVLLVYTVLGLLTDALVRLLERRALSWRRGLLG
ncbi:MAG TPA: ABC transporter permease subunit [Acidimicrobiales bacterium]|nr:ABC transporter permease subunit [Acidimicrobiales bacterium]